MMNPYLLGFRCTLCNADYGPEDSYAMYTCPKDGGNLDAVYDYRRIMRNINPYTLVQDQNRSIWHYGPLLPMFGKNINATNGRNRVPLWSFGWSPLYRAPALERALDARAIWLKDDGRLPSASFKDRASAMVIARALEMGVKTITTASTGNAASALATLASSNGIRCVIFVPENTPEGKLAMMTVHGAKVYAVQGSYDDAVALSNEAAQQFGWYNRNTGFNPYTREGKKTAAFEITEQLALFGPLEPRGATIAYGRVPQLPGRQAAFRTPDVMVVPVGDGNIISGIHKGFKDLYALGAIEKMPRFVAVTATQAPSLATAWRNDTDEIMRVSSNTLASGISVDKPNDGLMALRALRETQGTLIEASDDEMIEAMGTLARRAGVFVEPAAAAAYVGLEKARRSGYIRGNDEVVLQLTGSGLKDTRSALLVGNNPQVIQSLEDVTVL
jgi:threonine synthase